MKINIKATKLDITPAITQYIEGKIGSLDKFIKRFENFGDAIATVEISRTSKHHQHGEVYYAEVNLNVNGITIRAEQTDENMRAAIDKVKDTLKLEIGKYKDKKEINKKIIRKEKLAE